MFCDAPHRATLCLLPLLLLAAATGACRAAGPTKAEPSRKGFDYGRPNPGEILPNPTAGVGEPPKLMQFAPAASMQELGSRASGDEREASPNAAASGAAGPPMSISPPAGLASEAPSTAPASPAPPAPPAQPAQPSAVQALFAAEIARVGISGGLTYQPSAGARDDPAARQTEQRLWAHLDRSLAASRAAWDSRHPARNGSAGAVEMAVEPGHVTLLKAPGLVTGAFDEPAP